MLFVAGAVESAIERNDLTDQLVAMAPMAGYDVWLRACSSFATQLAGEGLYLHAANYLVVCNKVVGFSVRVPSLTYSSCCFCIKYWVG